MPPRSPSPRNPGRAFRNSNVGRLFADHKAEEIAYFRKTGIFPIMHVVGLRRDIVERYPWVPINLIRRSNAPRPPA